MAAPAAIIARRGRQLTSTWRRSGRPNSLPNVPGSPRLLKPKPAKEKPGTLGLLICDYRKSPAFQDLAPRTQGNYQAIFDYLRTIADAPLVRFDRPLVARIRDKAAASKGRSSGNYVKAVLSLLFAGVRSAAIWRTIRHRASKTFGARKARPTQTVLGAIKSATP